MAMEAMKIKYQGVDDWNRPVFMGSGLKSGKPIYFCDVEHLFDWGASEYDVYQFYNQLGVNVEKFLIYQGVEFGCEPQGGRYKVEVEWDYRVKFPDQGTDYERWLIMMNID